MEIYENIKKDIIIFCVVVVVFSFIYNWLPINRDTTDGKSRSGVSLHIDAMTGCEYLGGPHGGLIQRFDSYGNHICKKK